MEYAMWKILNSPMNVIFFPIFCRIRSIKYEGEFFCTEYIAMEEEYLVCKHSIKQCIERILINGYIEDNVVKVKCINVWK